MHLKFLRELSVVTVVRATEPQHIVLFHQCPDARPDVCRQTPGLPAQLQALITGRFLRSHY